MTRAKKPKNVLKFEIDLDKTMSIRLKNPLFFPRALVNGERKGVIVFSIEDAQVFSAKVKDEDED